MAKEKEIKLSKVLQDMSYSLNHIKDIMADDRQLLVKLVRQNNQIVEFLKQIEIEEVNSNEYELMSSPTLNKEEIRKIKRFESLKEVLEEFMSKQKDLQEFEEELQKHKEEITPGTVGES